MADMTKVTGPNTGDRDQPWAAPPFDLAERGYVMEEFIIEGSAARYAPQGESPYSPDGRWSASEAGSAPYRTRILVVRPEQAADFNGTVIAVWLNVTAGFEYDTITSEEVFNGYAWVGVSAQRVGIEGFPEGYEYTGRQLPQAALKGWDPGRYGTLEHPGDVHSFDMFTQAGRVVGPARNVDLDPMGGLPVERVIATGQSQSALQLASYYNGVHPLVEVFDGFLLTLTPGWAVPLEEPPSMFEARLRDDVATPAMIVNSEWEAVPMRSMQREDSDTFRFWEVAGAPHAVAEAGKSAPRADGRRDNPLQMTPVIGAAYRAMHRWLADGTPPPRASRLEFGSDGPSELVRDEFGNAVGGVRLPELTAPIAEYHGKDDGAETILQSLYGWSRPFSVEELRTIYRSDEDFRERYRAAVDEAVAAGVLLPFDADRLRDNAADVMLDLG